MFTNRKVANTTGIILVLIATVSLVFSWRANVKATERNDQLSAFVSCQAEWTNFLYKAITSNRSSNAEAATALDNLVNTISTSKSVKETETALAVYKEARAKQLQSQHDNPLPDPPNRVCQLEDGKK